MLSLKRFGPNLGIDGIGEKWSGGELGKADGSQMDRDVISNTDYHLKS